MLSPEALLTRDRACAWMVDAIDRARKAHGFHLWAYALMPEHVHLLVWPAHPSCRVSAFLQTLKSSVARRALAFVRLHAPDFLPRMLDRQPDGTRSYRFWQRGGGYDRNLWEPRHVWSTIEYIHANPTRRGLCERPEDWPWFSAGAYADPTRGPLTPDWISLPADPRS